MEPSLLASYVASRILHDMSSPVSALSGGVEMLADGPPEMRDDIDGIINDATTGIVARLHFLRYAFGSQGLYQGVADIHEAKKIAEGYAGLHKSTVNWDISAEDVSYMHSRLMMNMLATALECLPRGGTVTIAITREGEALSVVVRGVSERPDVKPANLQLLTTDEPSDGWSAKTIQPHFAQTLAKRLGSSIQSQSDDNSVTLTVAGI